MVLAELSRKYLREGFNEEEILKRLKFMEAKTVIVDVDLGVALAAGKVYL